MRSERIQRINELAEGPTVLDLGAVQHDAANACTDNWLHQHLVQEFQQVIGVDMLRDEVQTLNDAGYDMVLADVEEMQLGILADTVVAGELIEHVSNPGRMLDRVRAHLRPGGRVVLSTPNPWFVHHIKRWLVDSRHTVNQEHVAWYGPTVLQQLLERHGFDVEVIEPVSNWTDGLLSKLVRPFSSVLAASTWVVAARKEGQQ